MSPDDIALELAALELAAAPRDVIDDFIKSLPPDLAGRMRDVVQRRREFEVHVQRMLIGGRADVMASSHWIAANAEQLAHEWCCLRQAATRWAMLDMRPIVVRIAQTDDEW